MRGSLWWCTNLRRFESHLSCWTAPVCSGFDKTSSQNLYCVREEKMLAIWPHPLLDSPPESIAVSFIFVDLEEFAHTSQLQRSACPIDEHLLDLMIELAFQLVDSSLQTGDLLFLALCWALSNRVRHRSSCVSSLCYSPESIALQLDSLFSVLIRWSRI